ncbi:MAG TPA: pitrilysin family protein [Candidatus Saccharimonadales bacterium]|nr:pitrilysin family protein [Candidatus Saccharimonadales bacterium]
MNKRILKASLALAALLAAAALTAGAAAGAADPRTLAIPPLHAIPKVQPERYVMPNGAVVYLLENHDLPRVTGIAYFNASDTWAPAAKAGLGNMVGAVMRRGGTVAHPGDWLDDRLGAIGARIGTTVGTDNASGTFWCLPENTAEVVGLLAEILRAPAFPEDKMELQRTALYRSIAGRNDEMFSVLFRASAQAVFGKDSPYTREPEYATVDAITRDDCLQFQRLCFEPERMILAIYGDFKTAEMKKLLAEKLGPWAKSGLTPPAMPPMPALGPKHVVFAPKDDVTQSGVVMTHLGFLASDPDYPDMDVLENALGGGFQSRLTNVIRTQRGLAYAAGARSGAGFARPGVFAALALTRNDSIMVSADLVRAEVEKVTREPVTDEEAQIARETSLNSFVFNFSEPSAVMFRAAYYELVGYPQDFLQKYQQGLQNVTAASMLAAAKRHIHPDNLITVIVGREKDFDRPLTSLGQPVERMDISIPPRPSQLKVGEASAEALARGQALLKKAADLAGGPAAWAAVKSWSADQQMTITMQGQSIPLTGSISMALPDRQAVVMKTPMGEIRSGVSPKGGWVKAPQGVQDQPNAVAELKKEFEHSMFRLFGHPDQVQLQALPDKQTLGGQACDVALLKSELVKDCLVYFGPDGMLAGMEYPSTGPQGPVKQTVIYSDWRAVDALKYPYASKVLQDGKEFRSSTATQVRLNPALPDSLFLKPGP